MTQTATGTKNKAGGPELVAFDELLAAALREQARRELAALPGARQLERMYTDTSAWDRRLKRALAKRQRAALRAARAQQRQRRRAAAAKPRGLTLRRMFWAAAVMVLLLAGTLAVSAEARYAARMLLHWGETELRLSFETEGRPPETMALPQGYTDHYIPDGFVLDEENSFTMEHYFFHKYFGEEDGEPKNYAVDCYLVLPSGQTEALDKKQTVYKEIDLNGQPAMLGTSTTEDGEISYLLIWDKEGIHHTVHGNVKLETILAIAEEIY